jgi:hypothetical protein
MIGQVTDYYFPPQTFCCQLPLAMMPVRSDANADSVRQRLTDDLNLDTRLILQLFTPTSVSPLAARRPTPTPTLALRPASVACSHCLPVSELQYRSIYCVVHVQYLHVTHSLCLDTTNNHNDRIHPCLASFPAGPISHRSSAVKPRLALIRSERIVR